MSFLTVLYDLIIYPLELFFEVVYALSNRLINNPGLSIVMLSLAVNFLVLPLYRRVDAISEEEHAKELRMKKGLDHIKKTFHGDERFMVLQVFYRQNDYKPTSALRGSLSLVLEIPFFIAAYRFLSGLQMLQGVSFGPIKDLGAPDAMFMIGSFTVNLLPVLMTVINFISGAIYTKGLSFRSKFQLYAMAVIFLVFLYDSPSGLVFYWTLNNLFSLIKNILMKWKGARGFLTALSSLLGIGVFCYFAICRQGMPLRRLVFLGFFCLLLQLPLLLRLFRKPLSSRKAGTAEKGDTANFFLGCLFLTVLLGLLIPSALIGASPAEFMDLGGARNPLIYVASTAAICAGLFLVWFGIFYYLAAPAGRKIMSLLVFLACGVFLVNYMFFSSGYGNLSPDLRFDMDLAIGLRPQVVNLGVSALVCLVLFLLWKKNKTLVRILSLAGIAAFSVMSVMNIIQAGATISQTLVSARKDESVISLPLSKKGKNVVVIMMDRAVGTFIPYLFAEKPELQEAFDGFTYYHNTISYGVVTNYGAPALFGGYEYTPEEMNRRNTESLASKHNEALRVMPLLFSEAGYQVTVADQAYAGYSWHPDFSLYDDHPEIQTYHLSTSGRFMAAAPEDGDQIGKTRTRNFFFYSIFRTAPSFLQGTVYNYGLYNAADANQKVFHPEMYRPAAGEDGSETVVPETEGIPAGVAYEGQTADSPSTAVGIRPGFMLHYTALEQVPALSEVTSHDTGSFLIVDNDTTHEEMLLKEPEYIPVYRTDNTAYDEAHQDRFKAGDVELHVDSYNKMAHYHINMAACLQLARWFDWMRENGVYDNTRIILVSDHGRPLYLNSDFLLPDGEDSMAFRCLLMVKDFDSKGFTVSEEFMTNADTPSLAFSGLIANPVNPATGKPIDTRKKEEPVQHVTFGDEWDIQKNNGNVFLPGPWYSVHGDTYDMDNWEIIPDPITGEYYTEP